MIEIDFKQIPQWLQERNKLNPDWPKKYKALQLKQAEILGQSKSAFTYEDCVAEFDKLKNSEEGAQKTLFGGFSSKSIKTLESLLKLYQKENLHLVNMGQSLVQLINYDIPGIKKQLITIDQQITSSQQRIVDSQVQIAMYKQQYEKQCKKLGIAGISVEEEVPQMILQILPLFETISQTAFNNQTLLKSIEYYRQFTIYVNPQAEPLAIMTNLESFILKGNQKVQDWEIIETNKSEEIDWLKYMQPTQVNIQESDLLNSQFRSNLIIDLTELIGFFETRLQSIKQEQNITELDSSNKIFDVSANDLTEYLSIINKLFTQLTDPWLRQLLQLKSSVKSQQRVIQNLQEYAISIKKSESNIVNSQIKISDLRNEQTKQQNQLEQWIKKVKSMREYTEKLFSELFKTEIKIICD